MDKPTKNDIMSVGNRSSIDALRKYKRSAMKKDNRQVMNALVLVFQFNRQYDPGKYIPSNRKDS